MEAKKLKAQGSKLKVRGGRATLRSKVGFRPIEVRGKDDGRGGTFGRWRLEVGGESAKDDGRWTKDEKKPR